MLAENVEGIANATETVEMLNQAQEKLTGGCEEPWNRRHMAAGSDPGSFEFCISGCSFDYHLYCRKQDH